MYSGLSQQSNCRTTLNYCIRVHPSGRTLCGTARGCDGTDSLLAVVVASRPVSVATTQQSRTPWRSSAASHELAGAAAISMALHSVPPRNDFGPLRSSPSAPVQPQTEGEALSSSTNVARSYGRNAGRSDGHVRQRLFPLQEQVRQHTNPREPLTTRRDHTGTPDNKNNTNTTRLISNSSYPSNRGFRSNSTTTTTTTTSGSVGRDNNNQRYPKQPTDSVAGTRVAAKSVVNGTRVGSSGASAGAGGGAGPEDTQKVSYSQRVARLRKPALTAADKLGLEPEERARIFRELRTPRSRVVVPRRAGGSSGDGGRGGTGDQAIRAASSRTHLRGPDPAAAGRSAGSETQPGPGTKPGKPDVALLPLPLRVFCYGIDDVRLYRALEEADALGLVVVVSQVAAADAVFATRVKRTGKALTLDEISNAARNANKPFVELSAVSAMRVMEAVEELTGWLVPEHLRRRTPPPPLALLPPLDAADSTGSAEALGLLTGGLTLSEYILARAGQDLPVSLIRELDRTDLYDSRDELLPVNPQEREAARQRPVFRPYMHGSRMARQRLLREHMRSRAEAEGVVPW